jgi:hypothetical protein
MKPKRLALLFLVVLEVIGWRTAAVAADEKVICQTYGGPFELDDTDFKAIADAGSKITRANFSSLDDKTRKAVCDTRKLMRLIHAGKDDPCDFLLMGHYYYLPDFIAPDERDAFMGAHLHSQGKTKGCTR